MNKITIIPAIDLKDGKCVRLRQGRADDINVYSDNPVEMAKHWVDQGGKFLHVVDLDGAFRGHPVHLAEIKAITEAVDIPVEVGGGLRTDYDIESLLDCGVHRVILGTRAFTGVNDLRKLVDHFGLSLCVGIDARNGKVQVRGWVEATNMKSIDLARSVDSSGVDTIIYTDTATDGMLAGVNVAAIDEICSRVNCNVVASGGISSSADIIALKKLDRTNLTGAIVGKALYEGNVSIRELRDCDEF